MKHLSRIAALGALVTLSLASAVPALAIDAAPSEVVKYNDLNLTTAEGAKTLYTRLKKASRNVCRQVYSPGAGNLTIRGRCQRELLELAVTDVNKPLLTALHQGTTAELTASR